MPVTDADLNLIFLYLDNELSEEEERQLIQQMQENPELQQAFDQQVLMSACLVEKNEAAVAGTEFESADAHLNRISRIASDTNAGKRVVSLPAKKRWRPLAIAAAVAAVVIAATFYFLDTRNDNPAPIAKTPDKKIVPGTNDSAVIMPDTGRVSPNPILPETLYEEYHTQLADNDLQVPAAASPYQNQYRQGRYTQLANENENVVITKGQVSPAKEQNIINHFNFYKALSDIEINKMAEAEKLLKDLLLKSRSNPSLNNHAEWYLLLLYLKTNNRPEALRVAASITNGKYNLYQKKAAEILEKLSH